ncbi:MAG: rhomboid family intramembrane serine protease, partial [Muribaculaceae bacterium]|nr:rhomboid family intramembrane serine protease [Muribaculaceae bacterium]
LALYYIESPAFKPFQLLTYMFLHSGFTHLFFNMFALWMFGSVIERALGSKRFLIYYLSCGFGAALIQEGVFAIMVAKYHNIFSPQEFDYIITKGLQYLQLNQNYVDPSAGTLNALVNAPVVGASGAIYGILLAFGMLFPNQPIYLMFIPIPIKAKWMVLGYGAIELLFGISGTASNVAHWAHLGGMLFGVFMILYWKKRGDFNDRWYF